MHTATRKGGPVLAIFPTGIGFGYTLHKNANTFIDWGIMWSKSGDKNAVAIRKFTTLLSTYKPTTLVLEFIPKDAAARRPRISELVEAMTKIARSHKIAIHRYSRREIRETFEADGATSKQQIAEVIGKRIPELKIHVPAARRCWEPEANAMSFFSAASLALTHFYFTSRFKRR